MISTHPPVWWKAPLGPLTSGRDLCEALHGAICQAVHPGAAHRDVRGEVRLNVHEEARFGLRARHGPGARLSLRQSAHGPPYLAPP